MPRLPDTGSGDGMGGSSARRCRVRGAVRRGPVRRAPGRRARRRRLPRIDRGDDRRALPDVVDRSGTNAGTEARRQPGRSPEPVGRDGRTGDTSARRTPAIRSSRRRSRSSASSAGRRCSTGHWPASGCSSAPGAGSGASAASPRWGCTARPAPRSRSPGATTCRRSPTPRWSRRVPGSCCGRCWQPRPARGGAPGSASPDSWRSRSRPSSATPTS